METAGLNHTGVLYALGWAIAHSLWQMGLLWLIYQLIFGMPKNIKPAYRYGAAVSFVLVGFVWFAVTFADQFYIYQAINRYIEQLPLIEPAGMQAEKSVGLSDQIIEQLFTSFENFIPFLSAGYLTILIFLFVRLINAYGYTQRIRTQGLIPAGDFLDHQLLQFTRKLGLPATIKIYLTELIDVPATIGFFKPVILLPVATINHLSVEQVESIILHELAHIRRQDYLLNILIAVMETILFFNPFAYLLVNTLKKERELFCDDFVVSFKNDPHNYATALLHLEKLRKGSNALLAVAATGHDGMLLNRVKRIMKVNSQQFQYREKIIALFFISGLLSTLAWLDPTPAAHKPAFVKGENNNIIRNQPATLSELIAPLETSSGNDRTANLKHASVTVLKKKELPQPMKTAGASFSSKPASLAELTPAVQSAGENLLFPEYGENGYRFSAPRNNKVDNEFLELVNEAGFFKRYAPFPLPIDSLQVSQFYKMETPATEKELNLLIERAIQFNAEQRPVPLEIINRIQQLRDLRFDFHFKAKNRRLPETAETGNNSVFERPAAADMIYFNEPPRHREERVTGAITGTAGNPRKKAPARVIRTQPGVLLVEDMDSSRTGTAAARAIKRKIVKGQSMQTTYNLFSGDEMNQVFGAGDLAGWGIRTQIDSGDIVLSESRKSGNGFTYSVKPSVRKVRVKAPVNHQYASSGNAVIADRYVGQIKKTRSAQQPMSAKKITISIETTNETISIELDQSEED